MMAALYLTEKQISNCKVLIEELVKAQKAERKPIFSMERWIAPDFDHGPTKKALHEKIMKVTLDPCGTAACLAGKAGLFPRIRKLGFKWDVVAGRPFNGGYYARANFSYQGLIGSAATKEFFGESTFNSVFIRTKIRTLSGALRVLKKHIKDEAEFKKALAVINGE